MSLRALPALVRKDVHLFLRSERALLVCAIAPLAAASFVGFLPAPGDELRAIPIHLVDEDGSSTSQHLVDSLGRERALDITPAVAEEARAAVRTGRAAVAVIIPHAFGQTAQRAFFTGNNKPELRLLHHPSRVAELGLVRGILLQHVMQAVSLGVFSGPAGKEAVAASLARIEADPNIPPARKASLREMLTSVDRWLGQGQGATAGSRTGLGFSLPYEMRNEELNADEAEPYDLRAHWLAGVGILFALLAGVELGLDLLAERRRGLWRLRGSPFLGLPPLVAKAITGTLAALIALAGPLLLGAFALQVAPQGSAAGLGVVCVAIALSSAAFGLLLGALGRAAAGGTRAAATLAALVLVALGGGWLPASSFPGWMQTATLLLPTRWAVDGLAAMTWHGLELPAALVPTAVLLGVSAAFGALALALLRREEG